MCDSRGSVKRDRYRSDRRLHTHTHICHATIITTSTGARRFSTSSRTPRTECFSDTNARAGSSLTTRVRVQKTVSAGVNENTEFPIKTRQPNPVRF